MPLWTKRVKFGHQNNCSIDKTLIYIVHLIENSEKNQYYVWFSLKFKYRKGNHV